MTVDENAGTISFTVTKAGLTVASSVDYSVAPETAVTPGIHCTRRYGGL